MLDDLLAIFRERYPEMPHNIGGVLPPARALVMAALYRQHRQPMLCVTASRSEADRLVDDLVTFGTPVALFPESDMAIFDSGESDAERLRALYRLEKREPLVLVTPLLALLQPVPKPGRIRRHELSLGHSLDPAELAQKLNEWGYQSADLVTAPGHFAVRQNVFDLYPSNSKPVRITTVEGEITQLSHFSPRSQRNTTTFDTTVVLPMEEPEGRSSLLEYLDSDAPAVLVGPEEIQARLRLMAEATEEGWRYSAYRRVGLLREKEDDWTQVQELFSGRTCYQLLRDSADLTLEVKEIETFESLPDFKTWVDQTAPPIFAVTAQPQKVQRTLQRREFRNVELRKGRLSEGFAMPGLFSVVTDYEIYGSTRRPRYEARETAAPELDFSEGDLVIYEDRGIGRFLGLKTITVQGSTRDLLKFEYANEQTLSVPPDQIDRVAVLHRCDGDEPALSRLHTDAWQNCIGKALESILKTARSLKRAAKRQAKREAPALQADPAGADEFAAAFPYDETPSQKKAIEEITADLQRNVGMDRLLCGDVGFGKTEVALRAFFQAISSGHQAALLAPTTVLARQHFEDFFRRLRPFGIRVAGLWGDCAEAEQIVEGLADGSISAVVGTHRLLSKDITFKNLALLVVDEEQRFGVNHKEKIRKLSGGVHLLSLTATPIPRTTQLALAGVRDISLLDAPPLSRRPVCTYLLEEEDKFIAAALMRELERDGQAFVLHNRVEELPDVARKVAKLVPGARVGQAHGQMDDKELAATIDDFLEGKYDVLVCTTIIESGVDVPNVNTIVIKDAQNFGLSQLYQIRGRVGRSDKQAYCYLMVPDLEGLTDNAARRLQAIHGIRGLGGGYQLALADLEIRGAGNLLGDEQSGHIGRLGYSFYSKLLHQALNRSKNKSESGKDFVFQPPLDAHIPEEYIAPNSVRVSLYRRLAAIASAEEVEEFRDELNERFGPLPAPVENLLQLHLVRLAAINKGVRSIEERKQFGDRQVVTLAGEEVVESWSDAPKGAGLLDFVRERLSA